jgi:hypothetical protein
MILHNKFAIKIAGLGMIESTTNHSNETTTTRSHSSKTAASDPMSSMLSFLTQIMARFITIMVMG